MDEFIPQCVPNISGKEGIYLQECVDSTFVSSVGKFVNDFQSSLCEITNFKHCEAVSSGTCGLHLSLVALGVEHNDLVIMPTYTFIATANAVAHTGAKPWLFDIDKDTLNLNLNLVEDALKRECIFRDKHFYHKKTNQKIAAIMPVFCLGSLIDFEDIKNFRNKFSIPMVLDSAAALGSTYEDMSLGASSADISVLSFNGNKTFTTGGGGAVLTNNEVLYEKINHISTTARVGKDYLHDEVGFNYRMTNLQAAVGIAQLDRFKEFVEKKRDIQEYYKDNILLTDISFKQPDTKKIKNVRWLSHIYLSKVSKIQPKDVFLALEKSKIESRTFWIPMHKQLPYQKSLANLDGTAEEIYTNLIILPSSTNLDFEELERVTTSLNSLSN